MKESGLESLEERRKKAVDKFALKLASNPRYTELFPIRPREQMRGRDSKKYLEKHAKTSRMYNSPVYYMRRRLNALHSEGTVVQSGATSASRRGLVGRDVRCDFLFDEWR